jgi:hypothetical protein
MADFENTGREEQSAHDDPNDENGSVHVQRVS